MIFVNGIKANGALDCDGPFADVDEAITWAYTHDYVDYTLEEELESEEEELWPWLDEFDLDDEDDWDDYYWEDEDFAA